MKESCSLRLARGLRASPPFANVMTYSLTDMRLDVTLPHIDKADLEPQKEFSS